MLDDLSDLRESLFAIRLLREGIFSAPLRPDAAAVLRAEVARSNGAAPMSAPLIAASCAAGRAPGFVRVEASLLSRLAASAGGGARRTGPGSAFHGRAAPPPARLDELVAETLDTLNAPTALETWPPVVRACAAHFLVRIVQPFEAPPGAVGAAIEAAILAADGVAGDSVLLPEPDVGADASSVRPDPDAFVRARVHRLVERLAETADRIRDLSARAALQGWADERAAGLNARQRRLVRWLAEGGPDRAIDLREYVRLHAGRRAPSLRSLQRDWKGLRESGLLSERDSRLTVDAEAIAYGRATG